MTARTGYSFREAAGHLDEVITRLQEIGEEYAPIADSYNTFAFVKWTKAAKQAGLKPIYGVRLPVTVAIQAKKPVTCDFVFIAKDTLEPLNRLVELAYSQFRYKANLTYPQMMEAEGVIKIAGHTAQFDLSAPQDDLYIGLTPACSKGFVNRAIEAGHKFMAIQDNRYPSKYDGEFYELVCGRNASRQTYDQHILSKDEWFASVPADLAQEAWDNSRAVLESCSKVTLPKGEMYEYQAMETLREICERNAPELGVDLSDPVYAERLDRELGLIDQKGFTSYFHIIADMMDFARKNMLVGPGRGSSAGSLVAYLTKITQLDPIPYGLLFERFISMDRLEPADIDLDVNADKRDMIFYYMIEKYGRDHVARLGAVGNFKEDAAMNEVGKQLGVPIFECKAILEKVEPYAPGDDEAAKVALKKVFETDDGKRFLSKYPEMAIAARLCGHPRNGTQHAAGLLLTKKPIREVGSIDARTYSAMFGKIDAEELDTLKIDVLSLKQLAIYERCLELAGKPREFLYSIPLDDQATFDLLNRGHMAGVFQFSGAALRRLSAEVKIESLEDMIALTSLARPGPLESGGAHDWVARKNGVKPVTYTHALLEPILKDTLGVFVTQEQTMRAAREIGGLSWEDVSAFRRVVSKSKGLEALAKYKGPFRYGAKSRGVSDDDFEKMWSEIVTFSKYGFCAAHAGAYSIVSYQSAYLKAHFPAEFFAATLSYESDEEGQLAILREADAEGITYTPIDPEHSTDKWNVVDGRLIGPLSLVPGLGPKMQSQILSARARNEPLPERAQKLLADPKTKIDELYPINAALVANGILTKPYARSLKKCSDLQPNGNWIRDFYVAGLVTRMEIRDENEPKRIEDRIARGQDGRKEGQTKFIELRVTDDTGTIYVKVGCRDFESRVEGIKANIEVGKTLVCASGTVPPEIPMLLNDQLFKIGEME